MGMPWFHNGAIAVALVLATLAWLAYGPDNEP